MYLLGYNFILLYIEHAHFFFTDDYHTTRRRYPQLSWHRELNWGYKPITGSITSDVGVGSVAACFSFN